MTTEIRDIRPTATDAFLSVFDDDRDELERHLQTLSQPELSRLRVTADRLSMYVQRFLLTGTVFTHGSF